MGSITKICDIQTPFKVNGVLYTSILNIDGVLRTGGNLVVNGTFDSNVEPSWTNSIFNDWVWSSNYGGSAEYTGVDELGLIYQMILTPGSIYQISLDIHNLGNLGEYGSVNVYAGSNVTNITATGSFTSSFTMSCVSSALFAIQGYWGVLGETPQNIFIDNVSVFLI